MPANLVDLPHVVTRGTKPLSFDLRECGPLQSKQDRVPPECLEPWIREWRTGSRYEQAGEETAPSLKA